MLGKYYLNLMHTKFPPIAIVWLKRDLRLQDHQALSEAVLNHKAVLLLYVAEDSLIKENHFSSRHLNFIKESLTDMNKKLRSFNSEVMAVEGEVIPVLEQLKKHFEVQALYSHYETGVALTYKRDLEVKKWCNSQRLRWTEYRQQGVFRGLQDRKNWIKLWDAFMQQTLFPFPSAKNFLSKKIINNIKDDLRLLNLDTKTPSQVQPGGTTYAYRYLDSFFSERHIHYQTHISKPDLARKSCSRLSPYIAYGNLSMREVLQRTEFEKGKGKKGKGKDSGKGEGKD